MSTNHPRDDKKARLAEALRANLKRRKAQARARMEEAVTPETPAMPSPQSPATGSAGDSGKRKP